MRVPPPVAQLVRGFCMGAADIVPGVSGGTIALVLGIYERLVDNVHRCAHALKDLVTANTGEIGASLKRVEWVWLISLLVGVLAAVAALASVIERLLDEQPVRMGGLFFGLVIGSAAIALRLVKRVDAVGIGVTAITAVVLFLVLGLRSETEASGAELVTEPLWAFFLVGSVAICAMILPGISGSFILVLLGMYTEVLGAVNDRDVVMLGGFMLGAVCGLAVFSTLLNYLLDRYHDLVLMAMIGLMLGSLRVLWPWPNGTHTTTLALPRDDVVWPIALAVIGAGVVLTIERVSSLLSATEPVQPVTAER